MNVPESNVAVADVVAVSSVEADNPPRQVRIAIILILTARSNIFTDKRGKPPRILTIDFPYNVNKLNKDCLQNSLRIKQLN